MSIILTSLLCKDEGTNKNKRNQIHMVLQDENGIEFTMPFLTTL